MGLYDVARDWEAYAAKLEAEVKRLREENRLLRESKMCVHGDDPEVERLRVELDTHRDFIRRHFLASGFSAQAEALLEGRALEEK